MEIIHYDAPEVYIEPFQKPFSGGESRLRMKSQVPRSYVYLELLQLLPGFRHEGVVIRGEESLALGSYIPGAR